MTPSDEPRREMLSENVAERAQGGLLHRWSQWRQRRLCSSVQRSLDVATYSVINWHRETRELIVAVARTFASESHGHWSVAEALCWDATLQIDLWTDDFNAVASDDCDPPRDAHASLVYSLCANGNVAVVILPHSRAHISRRAALRSVERYIVEVIPTTWQLAGTSGAKLVRRHLVLLAKVSRLTSMFVTPNTSSIRFLRRLRDRTERYQTTFGSVGAKRGCSTRSQLPTARSTS